MGSALASLTLGLILAKIRLWLIDFVVLIILLIRVAATFLLFEAIQEQQPGFENIDIKQLQDSIFFLHMLVFLCMSSNWKIDLMISTPIYFVSQSMCTIRAYSPEGTNMDCYVDPETVGGTMASRWGLFYLIILFSFYSGLNHELNDFLGKEQSKK